MYSLISIRTILDSSSNSDSASAFASSVLPTPVGPKNRKEPIGFVGSLIPALERIMASVTFSTASSCPTTRLWRTSSRCKVLLRSLSVSFATGIPVHLDTIRAISSSVTLSCTRLRSSFLTFSSSASSSFCNWGSLPYCSSAALFRSYFCCASWIWRFTASISSRRLDNLSTLAFSFCHWALPAANLSWSSASSFCKSSRRSLLSLSVSFLRAASSISICMILRDSSSSSAGILSSSVLIMAHASSTRSMALSGRKRSDI